MLTSFFGKSNPVNFLLLSLYLVVLGIFKGVFAPDFRFEWQNTSLLLIVVLAMLFSMLLLDFIIRKNSLTQAHTLGITVFSGSVMLLPLTDMSIIWATIFAMLGLRRMFSLPSERNTEKKVLDASIWFLVASYFYFWSVIWFIPLVIAITAMVHRKLRYFFIPILGGLGVFLIATAYHFLVEDSFEWFFNWYQPISLQFEGYDHVNILIALTLLLSFFLWAIIFRLLQYKSIPKKYRTNYLLLVYVSFSGIAVTLFAPIKTGAELLLMTPPMAIVIAGYLEREGDYWLKEIMLWLLLLTPLIVLFLP